MTCKYTRALHVQLLRQGTDGKGHTQTKSYWQGLFWQPCVAGFCYKIVRGTAYDLYAVLHRKVEGRWTTGGISERNKRLQRLHSLVCLLS